MPVTVKSHTRRVNGAKVRVSGYKRTRGGWPKGRTRATKIEVTSEYVRIRLRDPVALRRRGFTRFRTLSHTDSLPGLTDAQRELVQKSRGKVVYAFGKTSGRPQSILIPRGA